MRKTNGRCHVFLVHIQRRYKHWDATTEFARQRGLNKLFCMILPVLSPLFDKNKTHGREATARSGVETLGNSTKLEKVFLSLFKYDNLSTPCMQLGHCRVVVIPLEMRGLLSSFRVSTQNLPVLSRIG